MKTILDYEVYKKSYAMALKTHQISLQLPDLERYELASQMRKASKSIPINLGEGYAKRNSVSEFKRYIMISIGSCEEMKVILNFAKDLNYIDESLFGDINYEYEQIGKMLYRLHQNWQEFKGV